MKWIKLTDKEPNFGEKYLLLNEQKEFHTGILKEKTENESGKKYCFINFEAEGFEGSCVTHYMKIELPKD